MLLEVIGMANESSQYHIRNTTSNLSTPENRRLAPASVYPQSLISSSSVHAWRSNMSRSWFCCPRAGSIKIVHISIVSFIKRKFTIHPYSGSYDENLSLEQKVNDQPAQSIEDNRQVDICERLFNSTRELLSITASITSIYVNPYSM